MRSQLLKPPLVVHMQLRFVIIDKDCRLDFIGGGENIKTGQNGNSKRLTNSLDYGLFLL